MKDKTVVTKPVLKSFNCPSCGATLDIKAVGISISVACRSCHSVIDVNNPNYRILKKASKQRKVIPAIPIGRRGKLSGKIYECIGFLEKSDGPYYWREYLLFNPYYGFRWLVENDGHWTYFKRARQVKEFSHSKVYYKKKSFQLFNRGSATVSYVEGEFYWRVKAGDTSSVQDFVAPPYMISLEVSSDERNWTSGNYMEKERIQEAFKLGELPSTFGVGANQPSPVKKILKQVTSLFIAGLISCAVVFVIRNFTAEKKIVYKKTFSITAKSAARSAYIKHTEKFDLIKTEPFKIDSDMKNLRIYTQAGITNAWLYMDILLVDVKTGKGIPLPIEIQYYKGYDYEDGAKFNSEVVNNIPKGEYYLSILPQAGGRFYSGSMAKVVLTSDVTRSSNLLTVIVLLFLPFLFTGIRSRSFEVSRWANGSENPYGDS